MDKPRVVIVGAGFGGLEAAKALRGTGLEVVLVDRNNYHLFQPLLYQVATAGLEPESIAHPVRAIFRGAQNFRFRVAEVFRIDRADRLLHTDSGPIGYDYLIVAAGSQTNFFGNEDAARHSYELKALEDAVDLRNRVLYAFEEAVIEEAEEARRAWLTIVIVGGGPTGVELAGAYAELVRHVLPKDFPMLDRAETRVILAEGLDHLLDGFPEPLSDEAAERLKKMGVEVRLETFVKSVEGDAVHLDGGETIRARTVIWAAGVRGVDLVGDLTAEPARGGRVPVTPALHLPEDERVYVIGDLAHVEPGHPMMAPVAVQQGRLAAKNILNVVGSRPLEPFSYDDRGMMATIGRRAAVATIYGVNFRGFFAWIVWLVIHLLWLIGFRNKMVVLINWAYNYFTYERGVRLITRKPKPGAAAASGASAAVESTHSAGNR